MRNRANTIAALLATLLVVVGMHPSPSLGAPPPHQTGSYQLTFAGHFTGKGNGAVGAKSITINAKVDDPDGNNVHVIIPNIRITDSRFSGTFTVGGKSMVLQGRLESAGESTRANRLVITYQYDQTRYGRIVGESKKAKGKGEGNGGRGGDGDGEGDGEDD